MLPHEPIDGPNVEDESCDLGGCDAAWAWETERGNGPRKLRLCEEHASWWLRAEKDLDAERGFVARVDDLTAAKVRELAQPICAECMVSLPRVLGEDRHAHIVRARHQLFVAMWRAGFSIAEVGRILDKDHTTVIAGLRKVLGPDAYKAGLRRVRVAS